MQLVLSKLVVAVEPKGFHSIPVKSSAPGPTNSEQLFMDDWSILLVCSDDQGQDTAVQDELHDLVLVVCSVQVGRDYLVQNWFIINVAVSKSDKSSSCVIQSRTAQNDVSCVF